MAIIDFKILKKDKVSNARTGVLKTSSGEIQTPYLMPVATRGEIIGLSTKNIKDLKIQCLMANTFHLHCNPGEEIINKNGGLKNHLNLQIPFMTDSGGFQAMSLGLGKVHGLRKFGFFPNEHSKLKNLDKYVGTSKTSITDKGIKFLLDDKTIFLTPRKSMEIQSKLGADIIMALDECTTTEEDYKYNRESVKRSHIWELESLKYYNKAQAIYGIIQGSHFKDLREESTKFILKNKFDGIAIGGSMGRSKAEMREILSWITPSLSQDLRPRHMLGIGYIDDLFLCVEHGLDTFDCVAAQREARHSTLYISPREGGSIKNKFRLNIKLSKYKNEERPIDSDCGCITCKNYTRRDLHKMYKNRKHKKLDSNNYTKLSTIHNLHFIQDLMNQIRISIKNRRFQKLKNFWLQ